MLSNRPYLIRAMFDWIVDNHWTPHLQIDSNYPGIRVPMEFAQEGVLVLNVHPEAIRAPQFENDWFTFKARFQGVEREIGFPPEAVLAIFARENGQGMPFPPEPYPDAEVGSDAEKTDSDAEPSTKKKPHLSIVK
ncbi:ClpXP protease specificity-enhancing factor [Hydrogenovibrio sp. SC-1]|uniref:ClpXP protease specificity-enhancing factor n=1 Tax=Hydrogenovibrio sp. SC-1 TaxID=2065820 RepID=UPI000C7CE50F|nr:ClpXP protease specificity-enhancing factor [Hydrogenovibrio sp. SC-1]PLA74137.1 ClpXP protease specificity-enhancing factor [Hydrogenovibrio sp. SC-1]